MSATVELVGFFVRGVDVAYDAGSGGYLVVGAQDRVIGVCVNAQGQATGAPITIKALGVGGFGAYPRARYSPHANGGRGAFLVVWPVEAGATITLHSRMVSCTDGLLGAEQIISVGNVWMESGAAVAYSATSQKFFVVWKAFPPTVSVQGRMVDNSGTAVGDQVTLSAGFGRDPGVAWNSATDDFGVSFSGETATTVYSAFVKVPAAAPASFARTTFNVMGIKAGLTTITDVEYNPGTNRYVMTWFEYPGPVAKTAEFDAAGNLITQRTASSLIGSYDALSMAFNNVSHTHLLVGVNRANDDVIAAELDGNGARIGPETKISSSPAPNYYTRVAASGAHASWNSAFNTRKFAVLANQPVQTSTAGDPGNPGSTPTPPPPPPPGTKPWMSIDLPGNNATVAANNIFVAGWTADQGAPSGTGVDVIHVWAFPTFGGSPTFMGEARYGNMRPDVGAFFGDSRFMYAGFEINGSLPTGGVYDIAVYARSTVTGQFTITKNVRVNAVAPTSIPIMWTDLPAQNGVVGTTFQVAGWAIDLGPSSGPGVDTVHVWAYPTSGAPPVWVGVANFNVARPDLAAAFGNARFTNSGFNMLASLPVGDYTLVSFAHSSVANAFNNVSVKTVFVR